MERLRIIRRADLAIIIGLLVTACIAAILLLLVAAPELSDNINQTQVAQYGCQTTYRY